MELDKLVYFRRYFLMLAFWKLVMVFFGGVFPRLIHCAFLNTMKIWVLCETLMYRPS